MSRNTYATEFPDYGILDVELPAGFEDSSWGNEACPCFMHEELALALYIDYADVSKREFPETERFSLHQLKIIDPEFGPQHSDQSEVVVATDDWNDVLSAVDNLVSKAKPTI